MRLAAPTPTPTRLSELGSTNYIGITCLGRQGCLLPSSPGVCRAPLSGSSCQARISEDHRGASNMNFINPDAKTRQHKLGVVDLDTKAGRL